MVNDRKIKMVCRSSHFIEQKINQFYDGSESFSSFDNILKGYRWKKRNKVMKKVYLFILVICMSGVALGQNTRSTETPKQPRPQYQAVKKEKKGMFSFLKKKKKTSPFYSTKEEEIEAFRKKMKVVYKQKAKEEKLAQKPEYSDPSYFGHKRPPKKRPPGKQKFCKVCKMKH